MLKYILMIMFSGLYIAALAGLSDVGQAPLSKMSVNYEKYAVHAQSISLFNVCGIK